MLFRSVTINVYYALQDTKTPTINSLLAIVLNIVINLLLMRTMEHKGLPPDAVPGRTVSV